MRGAKPVARTLDDMLEPGERVVERASGRVLYIRQAVCIGGAVLLFVLGFHVAEALEWLVWVNSRLASALQLLLTAGFLGTIFFGPRVEVLITERRVLFAKTSHNTKVEAFAFADIKSIKFDPISFGRGTVVVETRGGRILQLKHPSNSPQLARDLAAKAGIAEPPIRSAKAMWIYAVVAICAALLMIFPVLLVLLLLAEAFYHFIPVAASFGMPLYAVALVLAVLLGLAVLCVAMLSIMTFFLMLGFVAMRPFVSAADMHALIRVPPEQSSAIRFWCSPNRILARWASILWGEEIGGPNTEAESHVR